MITKKLLESDISALDLMHGELKNLMYQTECALKDSDGADPNYHYIEGLLDAYANLYEITYQLSFREQENQR